jgi:peptide/nickel transport system substrate-binding protein/microcin C transport system substrate-binding protein
VGYKNPVVDQMIDRARVEMDYAKRIPLLKKVYEEIAKDAPYVFMFNEQYSFYAHASRIEKPKDTFKYGIGTEFWFPKP